MKTAGLLQPTSRGLVFSLMWLFSLHCLVMHQHFAMAQINGRIEVDPNLSVTSLDDTMRTRNLTCKHDNVAVVTGGTFAITVKSIEWLFEGQLTAIQGPVFHVAASSLRQSGNYTCRVTYTYRDVRWEHQNVTEITREVVVVATLDEQFRLLTPTFVNAALRPPPNKRNGSSKNTVLVGSRFSFDCDATSRLTASIRYRLYRSDNPGKPVSTSKAYSQIMGFSDAVVWWCDVSNVAGHMYHFFHINVTVPASGTWYIPTTKPPPASTPPATTTLSTTSSASTDVHSSYSSSMLPVQATSPPKRTNNSVYVAMVYSLGGIIAALGILVTISICRRYKKAKSGEYSPDREQGFEKNSIQAVDAAGARSSHRSRLESTVSVRSTNPLLNHQTSQAPSEHGESPVSPIVTGDDKFRYVSHKDVEKAGAGAPVNPHPNLL